LVGTIWPVTSQSNSMRIALEALLALEPQGVFETFFEALASLSERAHLVQMFDSTVIRAHVSAAGAKGGRMAKHSGAPGEASQPRSISRPISTAIRSASI
jgi:hypothetical protein